MKLLGSLHDVHLFSLEPMHVSHVGWQAPVQATAKNTRRAWGSKRDAGGTGQATYMARRR